MASKAKNWLDSSSEEDDQTSSFVTNPVIHRSRRSIISSDEENEVMLRTNAGTVRDSPSVVERLVVAVSEQNLVRWNDDSTNESIMASASCTFVITANIVARLKTTPGRGGVLAG